MLFNGLVALGTLVLAAVAVFREELHASLCPRKLILKQLPLTCSELRDGRGHRIMGQAWAAGLKVTNKRPRRVAKGCRVLLVAVHREVNGKIERTPLVSPLQLKWAPVAMYDMVETIRAEGLCVDFGMVIEEHRTFDPSLYISTFNYDATVRPKEVVYYVLKIVAESLDKETKLQVFRVEYDGGWGETPTEMAHHLKISEVFDDGSETPTSRQP